MRATLGIFILHFFTLFSFGQTINDDIIITTKSDGSGGIVFEYDKKLPGTHVIVFYFKMLENAKHTETNYTLDKDSDTLFVLRPVDASKEIQQHFGFYYLGANPDPSLANPMVYDLPLGSEEVKVGIVKNLSRARQNSDDVVHEVYSFTGTEPFTVKAAKEGRVVSAFNDMKTDTSEHYRIKEKINYVTIEHPDGTYTQYRGLQDTTVAVKAGDYVMAGHVLGKTDYFDKSMRCLLVFVPFYWRLENPSTRSLSPNDRYKSHYIRPYFNTESGVRTLEKGELIHGN